MDHIFSAVVRRGVEAHAQSQSGSGSQPVIQIPAWGVASLFITFVLFSFTLLMVSYTCGEVITTLAMVESPATLHFEPVSNGSSGVSLDPIKPVTGPELALVSQGPITSSLRKTLLHLQKQSGFMSRFRGFSLYAVYSVVAGNLAILVSHIPGFGMLNIEGLGLGPILIAAALAGLHMSWTHIVITKSSPKYWFQRLGSFRQWTKVALPAALSALACQIAIILPILVVKTFGASSILGIFLACIVMIIAAATISFPATIIMTRVEASLLSDSEETIIPFDSTFDGKVDVDGTRTSAAISMLDAWKSFSWESRIRVVKIYLKIVALKWLIILGFVVAVAVQAMIIGKDFKDALDKFKDGIEKSA